MAESEKQFLQLLQSHRGIVQKVAGSYSRTAADRADLVQEICLQLWRSFPRYDSRRKFSTWMYRVALNVAISEARRAYRSSNATYEQLDEVQPQTLVADETSLEWQGQLELLYAEIARLEPLNRALMLLYLDDLTYSEMAEILGISETNVATKISRIKSVLRASMVLATKDT